jgi:hypothetical protein
MLRQVEDLIFNTPPTINWKFCQGTIFTRDDLMQDRDGFGNTIVKQSNSEVQTFYQVSTG